jgi:hypothetical protein
MRHMPVSYIGLFDLDRHAINDQIDLFRHDTLMTLQKPGARPVARSIRMMAEVSWIGSEM